MKTIYKKPWHSPSQIIWMLVGWVYIYAAIVMVYEIVRLAAK